MTPRTPAERERAYKWLYERMRPGYRWPMYGREQWADTERVGYDRLLDAAPQLWDSLPPDPAETARREAEEDGRLVEGWRRDSLHQETSYIQSGRALRIFDNMTARAAAGYPVLIAPKGET